MSETKKTKLQTFVLALGILVAVVAVVVLVFSIMLNATQPVNGYRGGDTVFMAYARFCNAMRKSLIGKADYYEPDPIAAASFVFGLFCCLVGTAWLVLAIIKKKFLHIVYFFTSILVGFGVSFGFFLGTESDWYDWHIYSAKSPLGALIFILAYVLLIAYTAFFVLNILSLVKLGKNEKAEEAKEEEPAKVEEKKEPAVEEKKEEAPKAEEKPAPAVVKEEPKAEEEKKEVAPKAEEKPAEKAKEEPKAEEKPAEKKEPAKKAESKKEAKPAEKKESKPAEKKAPAKKAEAKPAAEKKEAAKSSKAPVERKEGAPRSYHITQHPNGGWQVKGAGSAKALKLFPTQLEAIKYARELEKTTGVSFRVHSMSGKIRKA